MSNVRILHDQAMARVDDAFAAKLRGENEEAAKLMRTAFELERSAAFEVASRLEAEPTRSILHRSAASLAMDCGQLREAERLICTALQGNPPREIAEDLRDLLEQVYSHRHIGGRPDEGHQFLVGPQAEDSGIAATSEFSSRSSSKRQVLIVHDSKSKWQNEVKRVLDPHFECISLRYYYGQLSPFWSIFGITCFLVLAIILDRFTVLGGGVAVWAIPGAFIAVSYIEALYRRSRLVETLKRQLDEKLGGHYGAAPHVIAQDLGTFLIGSIIKRFPTVRFGRIILIGSVLPSKFDWEGLYSSHRAFDSIRNEIRRDSLVLRLVGFFSSTLWGLGQSGWLGFRPKRHLPHFGFIHNVEDGAFPCTECAHSEDGGVVHNIAIPSFTHNDVFVGLRRAELFWLPYLWGIEPKEYIDFLDLCAEAAYFEITDRFPEQRIIEGELSEYRFSWTGSLPLRVFIRSMIEAHLQEFDGDTIEEIELGHLEYSALRLIWKAVEDALEERSKGGKRRDKVILALNPQVAITRAVVGIVKSRSHLLSPRPHSLNKAIILDAEGNKERLLQTFVGRRAKRLGVTSEELLKNEMGEPRFLSAAEERARQDGIDVDELLLRDLECMRTIAQYSAEVH